VVIADFNNDGHVDLAASGGGSSSQPGTMTLWLGNGKGAFGAPTTYNTDNAASGGVGGDFNNDGWLDFATFNYWSSTTTVFLNDGTGHFVAQVPVNAGTYPYNGATADIDGDGRLDLVVPNAGHSTFNVQRNLGGGNMD